MNEERGRWVAMGDRGLRRWVGQSSWETRRGNAVIHYLLGRPRAVDNATLEDGSVVPRIETWSAVDHDVWRRPDGHGGYVVGRIAISDDGVRFENDRDLDARWKAIPAYDEDAMPMAHALARDPEFMARLQDDGFAEAVYASFCNRDWRHRDGSRHSITWRRSGGLVGELRQRNESYTDWYPYANAYVRDTSEATEAEGVYARLGWTELTREQALADQETAISLLEDIEARPPGDPRTREFRPFGVGERDDLHARAYRAWEAGKASDREMAFVADRIVHEPVEADLDAILGPKP